MIAMNDDQIMLVNKERTAGKMWQLLKQANDDNFLSIVQLIKEIDKLQMQEHQNIDKHIENLAICLHNCKI